MNVAAVQHDIVSEWIGIRDNGLRYPGESAVPDPRGEVVAAAGAAETLPADVDAAVVHEHRTRFPFLDSGHLDGGIEERSIEAEVIETGV